MELWYPQGIQVIPKHYKGNLLVDYEKQVLHSTESTRYNPSTESYFGHQLWPTATLAPHPVSGDWTVFQHLPLNRSGAAMRNQAGGVQTNNDGAIQIEIVLKAAEAPDFVRAGYKELANWILFVHKETGIPLHFIDDFHYYPPEDGWRLGREPWRMGFDEWNQFRGICGHQHVPENVHGDPGKLDIPYLKTLLQGEEEEEMKKGTGNYIIIEEGTFNAWAVISGRMAHLTPAGLADYREQFEWDELILASDQIPKHQRDLAGGLLIREGELGKQDRAVLKNLIVEALKEANENN